MLHFGDKVWYDWNKIEVDAFLGLKTTCAASLSVGSWKTRNVDKWTRKGDFGLSKLPYCLAGANAGHQAIKLVIHFGATKIVLIGFDMKPDDKGNVHWHHDHQRETVLDRYGKVFIPGFASIVLDPTVQVLNTYRDSAIKVFPFVDLEDVL